MSEQNQPPQHQDRRPGLESEMVPRPASDDPQHHRGSRKLAGKVALITGGDSGIGRAVAIAYAREGADIAITYLNEHADARESQRLVEQEGRRAIVVAGDVGDESFCRSLVERTVTELGRLDALPHLKPGSAIVNTTSVTAYKGSPQLLDYSSTKGAIVSFTRSLSLSLAGKQIRVNAVAPGPIWTPLIPSTFPEEKVEKFGDNVPMKRAGQPEEVAPSFVFLACDDASYISGQVLHPNGGEVVNG